MKTQQYKKHNSFINISIRDQEEKIKIKDKILKLINNKELLNYVEKEKEILQNIKTDLEENI